MNFFKKNGFDKCLLLIVALIAVRYFFFQAFGVTTSLYDYEFVLLVLACTFLATAGFLLNRDRKKSLLGVGKHAQNTFIALNILGVGIGFYLANAINYPAFTMIFILASALIYAYVSFLEHYPLVGNPILGLIAVLPLYTEAIFDLVPLMDDNNRQTQLTYFSILVDYSVFVFLIILMWGMVRDHLNLDADYKKKVQSLPILLGRKRSKVIIGVLNTVIIGLVVFYMNAYFFHNSVLLVFTLATVILPLLLVYRFIAKATHPKHFKLISAVLYGELAMAVISLSLYQFVL